MKLTIEKHPELSRLYHCFQKIELLANDMGIEVDELISESGNRFISSELTEKEHSEFSKYRAKIYKNSDWEIIR